MVGSLHVGLEGVEGMLKELVGRFFSIFILQSGLESLARLFSITTGLDIEAGKKKKVQNLFFPANFTSVWLQAAPFLATPRKLTTEVISGSCLELCQQ